MNLEQHIQVIRTLACGVRWQALPVRLSRRRGDAGLHRRTSSGLTFDMLRDYLEGDDVRSIDWKGSARTGKLIVRSYQEQQRDAVFIMLDVHSRLHVGSREILKDDAVRAMGSFIAAVAERHRVIVGGMAMGASVGQALSLVNTRSARRDAVRYFLEPSELVSDNSSIESCIGLHAALAAQGTATIVITDGLDQHAYAVATRIAQTSPCAMIRVIDPVEHIFPACGLHVRSCDGGSIIDLRYHASRAHLRGALKEWYDTSARAMREQGIVCRDFVIGESMQSFIQICCDQKWR